MEEPLVQVTQAGAVRTLRLNRPKSLNSFTAAMHAQLFAALEASLARVLAQDAPSFCGHFNGYHNQQ